MLLREKFLMATKVNFAFHPDLRIEIGKAADRDGVPMNEFVARVLADHLGRPELAVIPRKSVGRPRKELQTTGRK